VPFSSEPLHGEVTVTADKVIVDHPGGVHEGVADRRADKVEAATL